MKFLLLLLLSWRFAQAANSFSKQKSLTSVGFLFKQEQTFHHHHHHHHHLF